MTALIIIDSDDEARHDIRTKIEDSPFHYFTIYEAPTAQKGFMLIKQIQPRLILMDISLPDQDGISFGRSAMQLYPRMPILIISHLQMFEIVQAAINAGFSGYYLKPVSRAELLAGMERVLHPAFGQYENGKESALRKGMESTDLANPIESVLRYIQENYHLPLTLNEVASMVYLSQSHFSRLFKRETGMTFVEYLTHVRIQKSKYLLKMTALPIDVIANQTGFSNSGYFATTFKRIEGITPSEYRERFQTFILKNRAMHSSDNGFFFPLLRIRSLCRFEKIVKKKMSKYSNCSFRQPYMMEMNLLHRFIREVWKQAPLDLVPMGRILEGIVAARKLRPKASPGDIDRLGIGNRFYVVKPISINFCALCCDKGACNDSVKFKIHISCFIWMKWTLSRRDVFRDGHLHD